MPNHPARLLRYLSLVALVLSTGVAAHANTISGVAYCNISATDAANTPAPGSTPSGTECATFTASNVAFYSSGSSITNNLGSFLSSENALLSASYLNGFSAGSNLDNSFWQFTGTGYFVNGQTYTVVHDDGVVMTVNGVTVFNAPAPTSPVTNTFVYSGVTGNYLFTYDYTEQGGTSEYITNADVNPVPEPNSLLLLGTGAAALFFLVRQSATRVASREFLP